MRAAEALARAALAARLADSAPGVAPKACPSISAASIFLIFLARARVAAAEEVFATSFRGCLVDEAAALARSRKQVRSRAAIWSIKSTSVSGKRFAAPSCG